MGLLLGALLLAACGQQKTTKFPGQKRTKIFPILGDPEVIIRDTELNPKSFLSLDELKKFENFIFDSGYDYCELGTPACLAEDDETKPKLHPSRYVFVHVNAEWYEYRPRFSDKAPRLFFKLIEGRLELQGYQFADKPYHAVRMLHYSLKKDGNFMSFLFWSTKNAESRSLKSFYFVRDQDRVTLNNVEKKYIYLYGPGVPVRWQANQKTKLHLCGRSLVYRKPVAAGVESWKEPLGELYTYELAEQKHCPPFTDLNFRGLYFIDTYHPQVDPDVYETGHTLYAVHLGNWRFYDADILLFEKEYAKWGEPMDSEAVQTWIKNDTIHEMGHFLGLGHKFDGTPSIMSYDETDGIQDYDREAIRLLYR